MKTNQFHSTFAAVANLQGCICVIVEIRADLDALAICEDIDLPLDAYELPAILRDFIDDGPRVFA